MDRAAVTVEMQNNSLQLVSSEDLSDNRDILVSRNLHRPELINHIYSLVITAVQILVSMLLF